ncbi:hypothetical protein HG531_011257 [Fusarium graminearum]|nr:hypothetical protein HG531_011257 [Fusarium graminearum]
MPLHLEDHLTFFASLLLIEAVLGRLVLGTDLGLDKEGDVALEERLEGRDADDDDAQVDLDEAKDDLRRLNDPEGYYHEEQVHCNTAGDEVDSEDAEIKALVLLEWVKGRTYRPASEDDEQDVGQAIGAHQRDAEVHGLADEFVDGDS